MQQYRLTKKKRKENEGYKSSPIAEFSGETRFIFDPPLPSPFRFPFLIQLSSRVLRIGACSLGHRQSGNLKYIFEQNLFLIPCIGGVGEIEHGSTK